MLCLAVAICHRHLATGSPLKKWRGQQKENQSIMNSSPQKMKYKS